MARLVNFDGEVLNSADSEEQLQKIFDQLKSTDDMGQAAPEAKDMAVKLLEFAAFELAASGRTQSVPKLIELAAEIERLKL
ncbi:MAG: hypothetical protein ACPGNV_12610 [Mangrovicoccus sp.]